MAAEKGRKRSVFFVNDDKNGGKVVPFPGAEDLNKIKRQNRTAFMISALSAIIGTVIGTLIVSIILFGFKFTTELLETPEQVKDLKEETIPKIVASVEALESKIKDDKLKLDEDIKDISTSVDRVEGRIDELYSLILKGLDLKATNEYSEQVVTGLGRKTSMNLDSSPVITKMVAISSSGAKFSSEELSGLKVLLPYKDGAKNCYFYGQFNENDQWDGNCIVNVYSNGILELITDAQYVDGKVVSCKQVFPDYTTEGKEPIWVVSNRTVEEGISYGETWHFFREGNFTEISEPENLTVTDILSVETFEEKITTNIEGYYKGTISDGWFNDTTGSAYMIKYFRNGMIKTLYVGDFRNGVFNDLTGDAWMIGKKTESQAAYSHYKGPFKDGIAIGGPKCWKESLEQKDIDAYIAQSGVEFDPNLLRWESPKV